MGTAISSIDPSKEKLGNSNPNPTLPFGTSIDVEATCFPDEFETKIQKKKKIQKNTKKKP